MKRDGSNGKESSLSSPADIRGERDALRSQLQQSEMSLQSMRNERDSALRQLHEALQRLELQTDSGLQTQLAETNRLVHRLEEENAQMTVQLEAIGQAFLQTMSSSEIKDSQAQSPITCVQSFFKEYAAQQENRETLQHHVTQLNQELSNYRNEIALHREQLSQLEKQIEDLEEENDITRQLLKRAESDVARERTAALRLEQANRALVDELSIERERLELSRRRYPGNDLESDSIVESLTQTISTFGKSRDEFQSGEQPQLNINELAERLSLAQTKEEQLQQKLKSEMEDHENRISALSRNLSQEQMLNADLRMKLDRLENAYQTEIDQTRQELNHYRDALQSVSEDLTITEERAKQIQQELEFTLTSVHERMLQDEAADTVRTPRSSMSPTLLAHYLIQDGDRKLRAQSPIDLDQHCNQNCYHNGPHLETEFDDSNLLDTSFSLPRKIATKESPVTPKDTSGDTLGNNHSTDKSVFPSDTSKKPEGTLNSLTLSDSCLHEQVYERSSNEQMLNTPPRCNSSSNVQCSVSPWKEIPAASTLVARIDQWQHVKNERLRKMQQQLRHVFRKLSEREQQLQSISNKESFSISEMTNHKPRFTPVDQQIVDNGNCNSSVVKCQDASHQLSRDKSNIIVQSAKLPRSLQEMKNSEYLQNKLICQPRLQTSPISPIRVNEMLHASTVLKHDSQNLTKTSTIFEQKSAPILEPSEQNKKIQSSETNEHICSRNFNGPIIADLEKKLKRACQTVSAYEKLAEKLMAVDTDLHESIRTKDKRNKNPTQIVSKDSVTNCNDCDTAPETLTKLQSFVNSIGFQAEHVRSFPTSLSLSYLIAFCFLYCGDNKLAPNDYQKSFIRSFHRLKASDKCYADTKHELRKWEAVSVCVCVWIVVLLALCFLVEFRTGFGVTVASILCISFYAYFIPRCAFFSEQIDQWHLSCTMPLASQVLKSSDVLQSAILMSTGLDLAAITIGNNCDLSGDVNPLNHVSEKQPTNTVCKEKQTGVKSRRSKKPKKRDANSQQSSQALKFDGGRINDPLMPTFISKLPCMQVQYVRFPAGPHLYAHSVGNKLQIYHVASYLKLCGTFHSTAVDSSLPYIFGAFIYLSWQLLLIWMKFKLYPTLRDFLLSTSINSGGHSFSRRNAVRTFRANGSFDASIGPMLAMQRAVQKLVQALYLKPAAIVDILIYDETMYHTKRARVFASLLCSQRAINAFQAMLMPTSPSAEPFASSSSFYSKLGASIQAVSQTYAYIYANGLIALSNKLTSSVSPKADLILHLPPPIRFSTGAEQYFSIFSNLEDNPTTSAWICVCNDTNIVISMSASLGSSDDSLLENAVSTAAAL